MVPKIIKKHLSSSEVVKNLKKLTKDMNLAYGVVEISPLSICLKNDYQHFQKDCTYYVWHIVATVIRGENAGYEKHFIYKMHEGEDIELDEIKLDDVQSCVVLEEEFQYKTITYQRKFFPHWHYPIFEAKETY